MKYPRGYLNYGDRRDQELTKKKGRKPLLIFWLVVVPTMFVGFVLLAKLT